MEEGGRRRESEGVVITEEFLGRCNVGCEGGGRGLPSKECSWLLEAGKVKKRNLLEPPERKAVLWTL